MDVDLRDNIRAAIDVVPQSLRDGIVNTYGNI
jgi:hypothetical protein